MAAAFLPGSSSNPSTEVELTLSCRHLKNMDFFSKSDPMVVVSLYNALTHNWHQIARTEVIMNNLNPDFATKILVEYVFEQQQHLKFDVYDIDTPNLNDLQQHDFLGSATTSLGQVVSSGKLSLELTGPSGGKLGQILIQAEELSTNRNEVSFRLTVRSLTRSFWAWFNENRAYLEIHKVDESSAHALVYRSEQSHWSSPLTWRTITLPLRTLCGGDLDRSIRIRCFSQRTIGDPHLIGETSITLRDLSSSPPELQYPLTHPKKTNVIVGNLSVSNYQEIEVYSFLEYVLGGMKIHCTVAIDFTASNGDPCTRESLHYIHPSVPNQYQQALRSVVEILEDYDSDKQFPVLGFGARVPPHGQVSHSFYVNMHPDNPFCNGVQGVMEAYRQCIREIQLYGPTNFTPIINHVTQYAHTYQDGSQYFILLIITDGVITDMLQTKQAIIRASNLPLSIIIVGVGAADFDAMSELDSDDEPLTVHGEVAARDIVQFVAFREFQSVTDPNAARLYLAKEVLAEIPAQVVGFMKSRRLAPTKARDLQRSGPQPLLPEPPPPYEC